MKKQDKTLEEELSNAELGNQPEKEFRVADHKNDQRTQEN